MDIEFDGMCCGEVDPKPKLLERRLGERRPLDRPDEEGEAGLEARLYPLRHRHARHTGAVIGPHGGYRGQRFVLGGQVVNRTNLPGDPQFDAKAPACRSVRLPIALDDGWVRYGTRAGINRSAGLRINEGGLFTRYSRGVRRVIRTHWKAPAIRCSISGKRAGQPCVNRRNTGWPAVRRRSYLPRRATNNLRHGRNLPRCAGPFKPTAKSVIYFKYKG